MENDAIKLTDAARYYSLRPHQTEAWDWLELQLPRKILNEFAKKYRDDPRPAVDPSVISNPSTGKVSETGKNLIKYYEGLELEAYLCSSGIPTIGYGSTENVEMGMKITQEKAESLLDQDLAKFEDAIERLITVPLSQSQFDALTSWAFNVGTGAVQDSTLRRRLNEGEDVMEVIRQELPRWNKGPNGPLPGLIKRRKAEVKLAETGRFG